MFLRKVFVGGKKAGQAGHSDRIWVAIGHLGGTLLQRYKRRSKQTRTSGQDLVEFAIVLPLLMLVAFGVLDLGRLFHTGITITNSARVGARFAALNSDTSNGLIELATIYEAKNSGIEVTNSQISIYCPYPTLRVASCEPGTPVRVTINYDFELILGGFLNLPQIPLERYIEMVIQ